MDNFDKAVMQSDFENNSHLISYETDARSHNRISFHGGSFEDRAGELNCAISMLSAQGGGTLFLAGGVFHTTTLRLKNNVTVYIDKTAEIRALSGCDDEEEREYSHREYSSDQSHTSQTPYLTPENYMTKQDFGHSYFHNALIVGDGVENVKIVGCGRISGDGNLTKLNTVMDHPSGQRADKMISLKACKNIEIGGISVGRDLWYTETDRPNEDEPYYIGGDGIDNMLRIAEGGHFALLATGCERIYVHDIYAEKGNHVRDIFDFMASSEVKCENIYAQGAADDIVKMGSDCSLGYVRPCKDIFVRNIIGDTACNLFQIGSETAGDIENVWVDNLYVLAADKAGFSISVNDGGTVRNVFLNCLGTHPHRSVMKRCRSPFFLSITARGRTIGAKDGGRNIPIGRIENVVLQGVDASEAYAGSVAKKPGKARWEPFENQPRTTSLIVGCPGRDIENVTIRDFHIISKGGNPPEDGMNTPPELKPGEFNLRHFAGDERGSLVPAYGLYARHVKNLKVSDFSFTTEQPDGRKEIVICSD